MKRSVCLILLFLAAQLVADAPASASGNLLMMIGPDPCGAVPPVDLEAMTPYFDIVTNQCGMRLRLSPSNWRLGRTRKRPWTSPSGTLPELSIRGSTDGQTWTLLGSSPEHRSTEDALDVVVPFSDNQSRYVRFEFAERKTNAPMEFSEVEIWGREGE